MAARPSLAGLLGWSAGAKWRALFQDILDEHFEPACDVAGVSLDDLAALIGVEDYMSVWSAAFADLVSRVEPDGENMARDYLNGRGRRESAAARDYIGAHAGSVMSLHRVARIDAGRALWLEDLVQGGPAVEVIEADLAELARPGDRLGARLILARTGAVMAMGLLPFQAGGADKLIRLIERQVERRLERGGADEARIRHEVLAENADLFSVAWLDERIQDALDAGSAGGVSPPMSVRWPLVSGATEAARAAIAALDEVAALGSNRFAWRLGSLSFAGGEMVLAVADEQAARAAQAAFDPVLKPWSRGPSVVAFDFGDHFQAE